MPAPFSIQHERVPQTRLSSNVLAASTLLALQQDGRRLHGKNELPIHGRQVCAGDLGNPSSREQLH